MKLEGIHHITAITGNAPRNVEFYVGLLGMRLVKKTVNQDDPSVYHLFYGDDEGSPGFDLTFFEYPGARPGRAGAGMVHLIEWRLGSEASLDFWAGRLADADVEVERGEGSLEFADPEGLRHRFLAVGDSVPDRPLLPSFPGIPAEHALQGFHGARAYSARPESSTELLQETMGFRQIEGADGEVRWELRGDERGGLWAYDAPPAERGLSGGGTVHHIAWAMRLGEEEAWQERIASSGRAPTPVIDRFYFRSVYYREPSGVLFELATMGPGFATDEDPDRLGERLSLPPKFEPLRERLDTILTPLPDPRKSA
jgi:glyoxalase family protein